MYLKEMEPDLTRHTPSIEEPVQFNHAVSKASLVLPSETPGYRIVSDNNVLEVYTSLLKLSCNGHIDLESEPVFRIIANHKNSHRCTWGMAVTEAAEPPEYWGGEPRQSWGSGGRSEPPSGGLGGANTPPAPPGSAAYVL